MNEKMLVENTYIGSSTTNETSTQVYGFKASRFENKQARFKRDTGSSEAIVGVFHQQSQQSKTRVNLNRNYLFI
ncbi:hypothetical protein ESY86_20500 [Subsaximicrobium wynnwilliamsii]|uniref:Uncharacterized protein n=1 Tax=Subsaximicrobium wynnwilliamsii TaxID=291179 RepID=A0A5C6ZC58_9FLAO|nr:hypothetical protein [Subsaximicrobium wynnwilliamsii]TXD80640.1 hypothetical protein ESY87_20495 [Subsaximicrobium wynnwilliamsii]TXD86211.1 hypothetical protein ESY86_20500 [Subsaximicrobium wynnwilliamsii]TXD99768.1 hypothetical protein ESY88_20440 [Subsaximicrobium wynnwilliamsii]